MEEKYIYIFNYDFLFFFLNNFKVQWTVEEQPMSMCMLKGKSKEVSSAIYVVMLFHVVYNSLQYQYILI